MAKATRPCDVDGCDRKHVAKGMCSYHYRKANPPAKDKPVTCPQCGAVTMRRDARRAEAKVASGFCSLVCRDVWRIETGNNPEPSVKGRRRQVSKLPADHPVRVLIREKATAKSPLRLAFEAKDWPTVAALLRVEAVQVDDCWLWPRTHGDKAYGRVIIGKRHFAVHRLSKAASLGALIPSHTPVHHTCAEPLCINPGHLQLVTPQQNVAEMLERRYYVQRIADLEAALAAVAPGHPLITAPGISPAA